MKVWCNKFEYNVIYQHHLKRRPDHRKVATLQTSELVGKVPKTCYSSCLKKVLAQPTQGKPKGWKTMPTLKMNINYFDYLGLVSPKKGDHSNHKKRTAPPSGGVGKVILWPENNDKEIQRIQTGRKHSSTPAKYVKYRKEEDIIKARIGLKH